MGVGSLASSRSRVVSAARASLVSPINAHSTHPSSNFRSTADTIANLTNGITLSQNCGAFIDPTTLLPSGYIDSSLLPTKDVKGFTCPLGQICFEAASNPQNGTQGFDNFFLAAMQVVVVASANTWSTAMYQMMDTDFYISFVFFIVCIVVSPSFYLIGGGDCGADSSFWDRS